MKTVTMEQAVNSLVCLAAPLRRNNVRQVRAYVRSQARQIASAFAKNNGDKVEAGDTKSIVNAVMLQLTKE